MSNNSSKTTDTESGAATEPNAVDTAISRIIATSAERFDLKGLTYQFAWTDKTLRPDSGVPSHLTVQFRTRATQDGRITPEHGFNGDTEMARCLAEWQTRPEIGSDMTNAAEEFDRAESHNLGELNQVLRPRDVIDPTSKRITAKFGSVSVEAWYFPKVLGDLTLLIKVLETPENASGDGTEVA